MTGPIRLHPDSHRCFLWRGKAHFLLGSNEHYGALLNGAFDYERYFDAVASTGPNATRIFAFYRQLESANVGLGYANTLAPRPEHYLAPWARAGEERGAGPDGLAKFDLNTWDDRYFARLRALLGAADARGIVVELVFFSSQYTEPAWMHSPLHPASNVNGVGAGVRSWREFLTLADDTVAEQQRRVVRKLVTETNGFDNLYYEICNEPAYSHDSERSRHAAPVGGPRRLRRRLQVRATDRLPRWVRRHREEVAGGADRDVRRHARARRARVDQARRRLHPEGQQALEPPRATCATGRLHAAGR